MRRERERLHMLGATADPVATGDVLTWCTWFETCDRILERTKADDAYVVTMFTGIDRAVFDDEKTVLWETTIFGGAHHGEGQWYASAAAARIGHPLWCDVARGMATPEHVRKMSESP